MTSDQPDGPRNQRIPVMMTLGELKAIEDWRRRQAIQSSRSEAIRSLIELGLNSKPPTISDEAALPEMPKGAEPYDGSPV